MTRNQTIMKRAEWLKYCLDIGYPKEALPGLEEIWDTFKDENGKFKPSSLNIKPTPEEMERRQNVFLAWSQPYMKQRFLLMEKGFGGYLIKDGKFVETIIKEPYKQAIKDLDEHMEAKAKELGLMPQTKAINLLITGQK